MFNARMTQSRLPYLVTAAIVAVAAFYLLSIGRAPICTCGYVKLWHGDIISAQNSQHLLDWYSPSHLLHGPIFYGALWLVAWRLPFGWRLAIATVVESAWEITENSDAIINRYRETTVALDYFGNSVINSVSDIAMMMLGFWLASRLPVWASVAMVIFFEALTIWLIRDGLALNVIMLTWPQDAILLWQQELWATFAATQG